MYRDSFAAGELVTAIDMEPVVAADGRRIKPSAIFSALVSVALLAMIGHEANGLDLAHIKALIPSSPAFWAIYAVYFLAVPISEWIIYRRLWNLPVSGLSALLRKLVSNELLLGYLGEAQFYAWARSRINMVTAPFAAIKDTAILSAFTGNIITLVMLVAAWPLFFSGVGGMEMRSTFIGLGVVLVTSFAIMLFRQRLFSLPRADLNFIATVHVVRTLGKLALGAVLWHMVLPQVALSLWLLLSTLRMLVSRLPLVPNKDVVFAGLAVFLLGHEVEIASLMAMMAGLVLFSNIVTGAAFSLADLIEVWRRR